MYHRVYSPQGEPFDVSRDRADHLILERGWTQSPCEIVEAEGQFPEAAAPFNGVPDIPEEEPQETPKPPRKRGRRKKTETIAEE